LRTVYDFSYINFATHGFSCRNNSGLRLLLLNTENCEIWMAGINTRAGSWWPPGNSSKLNGGDLHETIAETYQSTAAEMCLPAGNSAPVAGTDRNAEFC